MSDDPEVRWLEPQERATWMVLAALTSLLPNAVDAQLQRDAGLSMFEYGVLAVLSERPDHTMPMSELATIAGGSLSRLSHLARRMETRDFLVRSPQPGDGRVTIATLTEAGLQTVRATAPSHVDEVRRLVLDPLPAAAQRVVADAGLRIIETIDPLLARRLREAIGGAEDAVRAEPWTAPP